MKLVVLDILSQKNVVDAKILAVSTDKIISVYEVDKGSAIKIYTSPKNIGYLYVSETRPQILSQLGYQVYNKELSLTKANRSTLTVSIDKIYYAYSHEKRLDRVKISYFNGTRMTSASLRMTIEEFVREFNEIDVEDEISIHAGDASAHHIRYTDAEAVASFGERSVILTTGIYINYDVSDINMLILDTSGGDVELKGLSGGSNGHIIFVRKVKSANDVVVYNENVAAVAIDRIYTYSTGDETINTPNCGGFTLVYYNSRWWVDHTLT